MALPAWLNAGANVVSSIGSLFGQGGDDIGDSMRATKWAARNSASWAVEGAKNAGLHPLYALGAPTYQFGGFNVGGRGPDLASFGQGVSRAVDSVMSAGERKEIAAYESALRQQNLKKNELSIAQMQQDLAAGNRALMSPNGPTPPLPGVEDRYLLDGQSGSGLVRSTPMNRVASAPGSPQNEPGAINDVGWVRTRGGLASVMSENAKERLEDEFIGTINWNVRNRLMPYLKYFTGRQKEHEPPVPPPPGHRWGYNVLTGEWYPVKIGKNRLPPQSMPSGIY